MVVRAQGNAFWDSLRPRASVAKPALQESMKVRKIPLTYWGVGSPSILCRMLEIPNPHLDILTNLDSRESLHLV